MEKILFLQGKFQEKIWGGKKIKEIYNFDTSLEKIGEYWAVSAMDKMESTIINGPYKGENLKEIYKNHRELFGNEKEEEFPLLVKIIDAQDDLSIQVHPDDEMAKKIENSRGKTECRYILNDQKASIIYGLKVKDKNQAEKLIDEKNWKDLLKEIPTKKGDFFSVPAGKVHAIKKGSLILEIQQASDITYRLYDYDRVDKNGKKRDLHIEKSKKAIKIDKVKENQKTENLGNLIKTELLSNNYFEVRKYQIKKEQTFKREKNYLIESVIDGKGKIIIDKKEYPIKKGDFFILTNKIKNYTVKGNITLVETNSKTTG